jgi:hypothetical protein
MNSSQEKELDNKCSTLKGCSNSKEETILYYKNLRARPFLTNCNNPPILKILSSINHYANRPANYLSPAHPP